MAIEAYIVDIVIELERRDLVPAIIFRTSRAQCDVDAIKAGSHQRLHLPILAQRKIRSTIKDIMMRYEMDEELIVGHPQYNGLIASGVGAHHAGQLLMWRLLLEELMVAGQLRVLSATGTVAAGVDFPARTVIITAHTRRGSQGYAALTSAELQQMSGRAGRRGKDAVGFCIAVPSRFCDARELYEIAKKPAEPLQSAYYPSPSTVLNLLRYRNADDLRYTVERSLAAFMDKKAADELIVQAELLEKEYEKRFGGHDGSEDKASVNARKKARKRIRRTLRQADEHKKKQTILLDNTLKGLEALGYIDDMSLSNKGYWSANLCTNLVLELSEVIESGIINNVSCERLVAIIASLCGEDYRQYLSGEPHVIGKEDIQLIQKTVDRVSVEEMPGGVGQRKISTNAAFTVLSWMNIENWQMYRALLVIAGATEGDASRLIAQTAEHLNQITKLHETHPELALRAEEGKRLILRPPLSDVVSISSV